MTGPEERMRFEYPTITDHGSIADHTFSRCDTGTGDWPPKDWQTHPHDKFGECSDPGS